MTGRRGGREGTEEKTTTGEYQGLKLREWGSPQRNTGEEGVLWLVSYVGE